LSPQRKEKHGRERDVCQNMDDVVSRQLKDQVRERRDDVTRGAWAERNYKYHLGVQSWLFSGSRCTTNSVALRCRSFRLLAVGQVFFRAFYIYRVQYETSVFLELQTRTRNLRRYSSYAPSKPRSGLKITLVLYLMRSLWANRID
jgi:hypothetical protein